MQKAPKWSLMTIPGLLFAIMPALSCPAYTFLLSKRFT